MWGIFLLLQKFYCGNVRITKIQTTKQQQITNQTMRFIGDYSAKTDAKGRVFLPAALRKVLNAEGELKLVLRKDIFQKCLVLYPESVWNDMLDGLKSQLNPWKRDHQDMLRKFAADAEPIELDSNGRLLISKPKLLYAGIGSDVRFLAVDDRIEIWSKENLDDHLSDDDTLGEEMESIFG